ncbi:methyltransferase domain-containing protein [candidate division KSB1 bacterium]|nr:methyltransferase domain-containing protein [candidate division KSB1 bacterium]
MDTLRRTFKTKSVQKAYSQVAWTYNLWSRLTESKAAEKVFELAEIQNGENILEVAVGTGIVFEEIVKCNPDGKNVGMDLSPGMLAKAIKRLEHSYQNYLNYGNVFSLPFKNNQFDLVINNYMFDLLPEEKFEAILLEFKRVLKNPGRIVITNMAYGKYWFHKFWAWLAKASPSFLTGCRPVSLEGYLKKTGFSNIQVVSVSQNTFPSEVLKAEI